MVRLLTLGVVVFLVACGGGGGDGASPGATGPSAELLALFPLDAKAAGTVYTYDVTRVVTIGVAQPPKVVQRSFHLGKEPLAGSSLTLSLVRQFFGVGPGGPVLDPAGVGAVWTNRGLELVAFGSLSLVAQGGPCITATTPGLLVAPAGFAPGAVHECSVPGLSLDTARLTWVGPASQPGFADAQRFDILIEGAYTGSGSGVRATATRIRVQGSVFLAPNVGPVGGSLVQTFLAGTAAIETRSYTFALNSVTSVP